MQDVVTLKYCRFLDVIHQRKGELGIQQQINCYDQVKVCEMLYSLKCSWANKAYF